MNNLNKYNGLSLAIASERKIEITGEIKISKFGIAMMCGYFCEEYVKNSIEESIFNIRNISDEIEDLKKKLKEEKKGLRLAKKYEKIFNKGGSK